MGEICVIIYNPIERNQRNQMLDYVKNIMAFRNENTQIFTSDVIHFKPDAGNNVYVFARTCKQGKERRGILVFANFSEKNASIDLSQYHEATKKCKHALDIIDGSDFMVLPDKFITLHGKGIKILNLY